MLLHPSSDYRFKRLRVKHVKEKIMSMVAARDKSRFYTHY